jgi:hypothetical protein
MEHRPRGPSSITFTILDNEENVFPVSRFHHPREGWRYKKSDYRIREFHIFASDEGGSAWSCRGRLRRNLKNGDCVWFTPHRWERNDCSARVWLSTTYDDVGDLFRLPMKQLSRASERRSRTTRRVPAPSTRRVMWEKEFAKKLNANTFEIKRTRRRR